MALTQVKTSGIEDDAVTTDKMQHATDGTLITYDANQVPVHVGPGNDGQVLTSQGAGLHPQFEDAVSEGTQVKSTGESGGTKFLREDGDGTSSWQTVSAGTALTGSTNNTITTVTGANAIQGEANLTFDGTSLLSVHVPSATGEPAINFTNSDTGTGTGNGFGIGINDAESPYIWNRENTDIRIATNGSERARIDSSGQVYLGCTDQLSDYASDRTKLSIHHTGDSGGYLELGGDQTAAGYSAGTILFCNTNNSSSVRNVGMMRAEIVTSDNNAGDDSGADLCFYNRAEGGGPLVNLKVKSDRNCQIVDGNLIVADGHGIDFGSTGNGSGSMQNELLDDYEEGTWTAVLGGTTNHSSYNVTANTAYYTKIGRLVTLFFRFEGKDLNNSAAGQLRISGVPYDPATGGGWTSNFTTYNVAFDTSERQQLYISGPNIYGIESANNSSWSDWQVSDFHNSTMYLRCNLTYHTS